MLVVEHDKDMMIASDYVIDIGPEAGKHGGEIISIGTPEELLKSKTLQQITSMEPELLKYLKKEEKVVERRSSLREQREIILKTLRLKFL